MSPFSKKEEMKLSRYGRHIDISGLVLCLNGILQWAAARAKVISLLVQRLLSCSVCAVLNDV